MSCPLIVTEDNMSVESCKQLSAVYGGNAINHQDITGNCEVVSCNIADIIMEKTTQVFRTLMKTSQIPTGKAPLLSFLNRSQCALPW